MEKNDQINQDEVKSVARAALDYIDALPKDVVAELPAMPGFDRDWAESVLVDAAPSQQWIPVTYAKPDTNSSRRVCVFTPSEHHDLRYRFVSADIFKQVCSEATHWFYITDPKGHEKVNLNLQPDVNTGLDIIADTIGANVPREVLEKVLPAIGRFTVDLHDTKQDVFVKENLSRIQRFTETLDESKHHLVNEMLNTGWVYHSAAPSTLRFSKPVDGKTQYRDVRWAIKNDGNELIANVWNEDVEVDAGEGDDE